MDLVQPSDVLTVSDLALPDVEWRYPLAVSALAEWLPDVTDGPIVRRLRPLFRYGGFVATPGALAMAERLDVSPLALLALHVRGVWGDVPSEDATENDLSVQHGYRILSSYPLEAVDGYPSEPLWLITEADRSVTTVLRPDDY